MLHSVHSGKRMKNLLLCGVIFSLALPLSAATVAGQVRFETRRGQRPVINETVISLEASQPVKPSKSEEKVVTTRSKTLIPHVVAVPVGSTIRFPNEDPISHNLFSVSPAKRFDLGFYRAGTGKAETFEKPGVVQIYCNVHPNMSAVVHVMTTPYYTFAGQDGTFRFDDVPPGKYKLRASNELGESSSEIVVGQNGSVSGPVTVTIDSRKFRGKAHMNKHGQPYERRREY